MQRHCANCRTALPHGNMCMHTKQPYKAARVKLVVRQQLQQLQQPAQVAVPAQVPSNEL
jgi:hypothetical protein